MDKPKKQHKKYAILLWILPVMGVLLWVSNSWYDSTDTIKVSKNQLTIEGDYGIVLDYNEIKKLELIDSLPKKLKRYNGYEEGNVKKGRFSTGFNQRVSLVLNSNAKPYLYIETEKNRRIYFSETTERNKDLYNQITSALEVYSPNYIYFED
ncbi:MAG: hypothetical protein AAF090_08415 [Bacteroidota bacterium]